MRTKLLVGLMSCLCALALFPGCDKNDDKDSDIYTFKFDIAITDQGDMTDIEVDLFNQIIAAQETEFEGTVSEAKEVFNYTIQQLNEYFATTMIDNKETIKLKVELKNLDTNSVFASKEITIEPK